MEKLYEDKITGKLICLVNDVDGFFIAPLRHSDIFFKVLKENAVLKDINYVIKVGRKNLVSCIEYADYVYDLDNDIEFKNRDGHSKEKWMKIIENN